MTQTQTSSKRALLLGGLLPIIAFTAVEELYGPLWGAVAGIVFAVGEISFEWFKYGKVQTITWVAGLLIILLGGISVAFQDGIWFKLQPAILETVMAGVLWGTVMMGKPLLTTLAEKQGTFKTLPPEKAGLMRAQFHGFSIRLGLFFFLHAILATYAAFYWSTTAWALLKGVGVTVSMMVYMAAEILVMRKKMASRSRA